MIDRFHKRPMQIIKLPIERQAAGSTGHVGPQGHSGHSFKRRVQGAASDARDEGVEVQIGPDKCARVASEHRPKPLLEQEVEVKPLALRPLPRGGQGGGFGGNGRPECMELRPVSMPMRYAQHACDRLPLTDEDANAVSYLNHAEVRQRRERLPQDRHADVQLERQLSGRLNPLSRPQIAGDDSPSDLVCNLCRQRTTRDGAEIGSKPPEIN